MNRMNGYKLLHDGCVALAQIETSGMRIDVAYLDKAIRRIARDIDAREQELRLNRIYRRVYRAWQKKFRDRTNLGSRHQLATVLFDVLKYESPDKTATGKHKADRTALEKIDLPFVKNYLMIEKLKKTKGTYLEGIRNEVVDGYLHPVFSLHTTRTFRSSGERPNFQNLPIRDPDMGKYVRKCFIARPGHVLVEIDYKGIEVRVAACYHKDPAMLRYINDPNADMHRDMASQIYCIPAKQVSKQARDAAKSYFVFAQFYGDYYIHCAANLWNAIDGAKLATVDGVPLKEVLAKKGIKRLGELNPRNPPGDGTFEKHLKEVEEDFWGRRFGVYGAWKKEWWQRYQDTGGFNTLTDFRVDGVYTRNEVINSPVQGSAFHCLLWSLIRLQKWLVKNDMQSRIIGQIHDSIVADVHLDELQDYLNKARKVMTQDICKHWPWIITPLDVEVEIAPEHGSWYEKAPWVEKNGTWQEKA